MKEVLHEKSLVRYAVKIFKISRIRKIPNGWQVSGEVLYSLDSVIVFFDMMFTVAHYFHLDFTCSMFSERRA